MAVKRRGKRQSNKPVLTNAVRSHVRRLRPRPPAAEQTTAQPRAPEPATFPADLIEDKQANEPHSRPPVMLVITVLAVLFISLIAWFVAQMPAK